MFRMLIEAPNTCINRVAIQRRCSSAPAAPTRPASQSPRAPSPSASRRASAYATASSRIGACSRPCAAPTARFYFRIFSNSEKGAKCSTFSAARRTCRTCTRTSSCGTRPKTTVASAAERARWADGKLGTLRLPRCTTHPPPKLIRFIQKNIDLVRLV